MWVLPLPLLQRLFLPVDHATPVEPSADEFQFVFLRGTDTRAGSSFSVVVMSFTGEFEISSIIEASKCMGSDKITERRKNAETLEKLLSNQVYVSILDENTDTEHGFTWNDIFSAAKAYMSKVKHNRHQA